MRAFFPLFLSAFALAFLPACSGGKKDGPTVNAEISLRQALLAIPGSPDKFFVNIDGDGMTTVAKTISAASVNNETLNVPAGRNRVVKVMAFIDFTGDNFVTTGSFKYVYGASAPFDLQGGDQKEVAIDLRLNDSVAADAYPFIVKFSDEAGQPWTNGSVALRRSSDGLLLGEMARTDANGVAYTRFLRFPFAVDVLIDGQVMARGLDLTANTLSGSHYLVNTNTTVAVDGGNLRIAVGVFSLGAPGLTGYTLNGFATAVADKKDPFTNGVIPDLNSRLSSNANLSNLALSAGTLTPAFAAGTTAYTASVANNVNSLTLTPTSADAAATIKVNGNATNSGSPSGAVSLNVGSNTIPVLVTAANGSTKTYTVVVTRAASSNNNLSALSLSSGTLTPTFATGTTTYTAMISDIPSNFTVTASSAEATATIEVRINGGSYETVTSGTASSALTPTTGSNTLEIRVTAGDGSQKTYTVTITYGICGAGYYSDGQNSCIQVTKGFWSPAADNARYTCSNKPSNAFYTSPTASTNNCPWSCNSGFISNGTSCNSYPNAQVLSCDDNEIAVGLWGRSGSIIDKLGVRCRAFDDGKFTGASRSGPGYGGEGGGPFNYDGSADCPDGYSLTEVDGHLATFMGVHRSGQIRFRCNRASDGQQSGWSPGAGYWGSSSDRGAFNFKCGTGANPYGSHINGVIIDNAGGAAYTGDTLGITCR